MREILPIWEDLIKIFPTKMVRYQVRRPANKRSATDMCFSRVSHYNQS